MDLNIPGCEMQLLAKDGMYIYDFPHEISSAKIPAGGRADIMARCSEPSEKYAVNGFTGQLAMIQTAIGPVIDSTTNDLEPWTPPYPAYLSDLQSTSASPGCSCTTELDNKSVNDISFHKGNVLHTLYLGAVVK